jgi:hypothetical protein
VVDANRRERGARGRGIDMRNSRTFHLFISPKHFEKCSEYGLFGVSEGKMNELANVHKGDIAFFYTTEKIGSRTLGQIYGPYEITSELFYNDKVVWEGTEDPTIDKYPFRIKLKLLEEHICTEPISVQKLWDLKEEGKIRTIMDSSALINKAVCNLFLEEGKLLLQSLIQANQFPTEEERSYLGHDLEENKIDLFRVQGKSNKFKRESYLESYLLKNPSKLHELSGFPAEKNDKFQTDILNQVRTYVAGGAIDIICLYKKRIIGIPLILSTAVFELKTDVLEKDNVDQLTEYIEWTSRLIPGSNLDMIQGVLVGCAFGSKDENRKKDLLNRIKEVGRKHRIKAYQYIIDGAKKEVIFEKVTE